MKDSPLLLQQIDALQLSIKHLKNENNLLKVRCGEVSYPSEHPQVPTALSGSQQVPECRMPGLRRAVCWEVEQEKREGKVWGGWGERGAMAQGRAVSWGWAEQPEAPAAASSGGGDVLTPTQQSSSALCAVGN